MALIKCSECGSSVSDKATSCPQCGNPIQGQHKTQNEPTIHCPKCNSTQLELFQKGFSGGKALVGAVTFGSLGLLAGTHGSKDVYLGCKSCGEKFNPLQANKRDANGEIYKKTLNEYDKKSIIDLLKGGDLSMAVFRYMHCTGLSDKKIAVIYVKELASENGIKYDNDKMEVIAGNKISNTGCIFLSIVWGIAIFIWILYLIK